MGSSQAIVSAGICLYAGVTSRIPCDEVIGAMFRIGKSMPSTLRETGEGGLAATPTGRALAAKVFGPAAASKEG